MRPPIARLLRQVVLPDPLLGRIIPIPLNGERQIDRRHDDPGPQGAAAGEPVDGQRQRHQYRRQRQIEAILCHGLEGHGHHGRSWGQDQEKCPAQESKAREPAPYQRDGPEECDKGQHPWPRGSDSRFEHPRTIIEDERMRPEGQT